MAAASCPLPFSSYTAFTLLSAFNEIPSTSELQHITQLGDDPPPPQILRIREKTQAPVYIGGGLPPIPARLVKRIEDGQFVEMAELLPDHLSSSPYTDEDQANSSKVKYKEVLNIIEWLQCFSLYIAVIARSNASHVVDLLGYQNLIVQSQLKYRDGCWAVYDRQFRQKASAVSIPEWSVIDTTLWNLAFAGQGIPSSSNDKGQYKGTFRNSSSQYTPSRPSPHTKKRPICLEWNDSPSPGCPHPGCRYDHTCYRCAHNPNEFNKNHKAIFCPNREKPHQ